MAHIRENSHKPTATVSFNPVILSKIEDYQYTKRKGNRSQAIEELIKYGLKYVAILEKKRERIG